MSHNNPSKRRKISPAGAGRQVTGASNGIIGKQVDDEQIELAYHNRAKKHKSKDSQRLPIKTSEGWIEHAEHHEVDITDTDSLLASGNDALEDQPGNLESEARDTEPIIPPRQQILEAKEELSRLAALINEDPEEHLASLKALARISESRNSTIKKLAIATQCAVYKDIIPGYRVRPWSDEDVSSKMSKDVRKLRTYERALVTGYESYVRGLELLCKGLKGFPESDQTGLASVALSCVRTLLLEAPHFNFRGDLIKVIVTRLSRRKHGQDFSLCLKAVEELFQQDEEGQASMDAVSQLTRMIKSKNYSVHESVLNVFLHLRLLGEFRSKASHQRVDKTEEDVQSIRQSKKNRQFLTKRERKMRKERKVVDKEMQEADAVVSHEERDKMQAEMLKLVFATYFRILKAGSKPLMGAVLEGLARYAHLINQDFFGDVLEALKDLMHGMDADTQEDGDIDDQEVEESEAQVRNTTREALLCGITAFALLEGQDASKAATTLHLDLNYFVSHLYQTLYPVALNADIELGPRTLRLADPFTNEGALARVMRVNAQTTTVLLIRCLSAVLLPAAAIRSVPPLRLAAFTKQLMTASLQLPEKSCLAMLSLLAQVSKIHGRKIAGLWNTEERRGDGRFDALKHEFESSNPFATNVWEGELLRMHYCPKIREQIRLIERNIRSAH